MTISHQQKLRQVSTTTLTGKECHTPKMAQKRLILACYHHLFTNLKCSHLNLSNILKFLLQDSHLALLLEVPEATSEQDFQATCHLVENLYILDFNQLSSNLHPIIINNLLSMMFSSTTSIMIHLK